MDLPGPLPGKLDEVEEDGDSLKAFIAQQAPVSYMETIKGLGSLDRKSSGNHRSVKVARQQVGVEVRSSARPRSQMAEGLAFSVAKRSEVWPDHLESG
eukprot:725885-Heterocapsa_arctica.AAC.1